MGFNCELLVGEHLQTISEGLLLLYLFSMFLKYFFDCVFSLFKNSTAFCVQQKLKDLSEIGEVQIS